MRLRLACGFVLLLGLGLAARAEAEPVCKNGSGKGRNFVFACDEVCAQNKADACQGIYWKDRRGRFHQTRYRKLLKRCTQGLHRVSPDTAGICGCPWYWEKERCHLNHQWQVDCNTFCFFERIDPSGHNCQGLIWADGKGRWGNATFKAGRCWATSFSTLGRSVKRSYATAACGDCSQVRRQVRPRKTAAEIARDMRAPLSDATARILAATRDQIRSWVMCVDLNACPRGPDGGARCTKAYVKPCRQITSPNALKVRVNSNFCERREEGTSEPVCGPSGDMVYESGINCLAGNPERCNEIKASQDRSGTYGPVGAWYRNPDQKRHRKGPRHVLFSRDQSLGVMEYLIATKDKAAAELWFRFIANNPKMNKVFWNLCPSREGATKPDDRCRVLPDTLALYSLVARYIGLDFNKIPKKLRRSLNLWGKLRISRISNRISAAFVRVRTGKAFEGSLQVRTVNILAHIGQARGRIGKGAWAAAETLDRRSNHLNPGWHFIAQRKRPTEYVGWLLRQFCEPSPPGYGEMMKSWGILNRTEARRQAANLFFSTAQHQYYPGINEYGFAPVHNGHECADFIDYVLQHRSSSRAGPQRARPQVRRRQARVQRRRARVQRRQARVQRRAQRRQARAQRRTRKKTRRRQRRQQRRVRRRAKRRR